MRTVGVAVLLIAGLVLLSACNDSPNSGPQGNAKEEKKAQGNRPPTEDEVKQTLTKEFTANENANYCGGKAECDPIITVDFGAIDIGGAENAHTCLNSADPSIKTDFPVRAPVTLTRQERNPIILEGSKEANERMNTQKINYGMAKQPNPEVLYFFKNSRDGQWNFCSGNA